MAIIRMRCAVAAVTLSLSMQPRSGEELRPIEMLLYMASAPPQIPKAGDFSLAVDVLADELSVVHLPPTSDPLSSASIEIEDEMKGLLASGIITERDQQLLQVLLGCRASAETPRAPVTLIGAEPWAISDIMKLQSDNLFNSLNPQGGLLTGGALKPVLMASGLKEAVLSKVWVLSDIDVDGCLDSEEFALAQYLMEYCRSDPTFVLPDVLPHNLIPPSKRIPSPSLVDVVTSTDGKEEETEPNVGVAPDISSGTFETAPADDFGFDSAPAGDSFSAGENTSFGFDSTVNDSSGGFGFDAVPADDDSNGGFGFDAAPAADDSNGGFGFDAVPAADDSNGGFGFDAAPAADDSNGGFGFDAAPAADDSNGGFGFDTAPAADDSNGGFGFDAAPAADDSNGGFGFDAAPAADDSNGGFGFDAAPAADDSNGGFGFDAAPAADDSNGGFGFDAAPAADDSNGGFGFDAVPAADDSNGGFGFDAAPAADDSNGGFGFDAAPAADDSNGGFGFDAAPPIPSREDNGVATHLAEGKTGIATNTAPMPLSPAIPNVSFGECISADGVSNPSSGDESTPGSEDDATAASVSAVTVDISSVSVAASSSFVLVDAAIEPEDSSFVSVSTPVPGTEPASKKLDNASVNDPRWALTPVNLSNYGGHFRDQLTACRNFNGEAAVPSNELPLWWAVPFLAKAKLQPGVLLSILTLTASAGGEGSVPVLDLTTTEQLACNPGRPMDISGRLGNHKFNVAMHLVRGVCSGLPLPNNLPPPLKA